MAQITNAQIADKYQWENRVLLIFAPDANDAEFKQQLSILTQKTEEVTDRDLVFYKIFADTGLSPDNKTLSADETSTLRKNYAIKTYEFTCVLVGKDGGEKFRKQEPITLKELFAIIDAMPMRKSEMKKGN